MEEKSQEKVSNDLKRNKYYINIILIGNAAVGKSSLIERIINNSFRFNTIPTIGQYQNYIKVDLKNHSSINYNYIDTGCQEQFINSWIHLLDKANIIIFVNVKDKLDVNTYLIEKRVLLSDVKVICCINKKDQFSDAENAKIIKNFKEKNEKLKDEPIILTSALTSDGIDELKNKINEYSINIMYNKMNVTQNENVCINLNSKLSIKEKKKCCS